MWVLPKFDWPEKKQKCLACAHLSTYQDYPKFNSNSTVLCCQVSPFRARRGIGTCIDNRERGPCGPSATQFVPKKEVDMS